MRYSPRPAERPCHLPFSPVALEDDPERDVVMKLALVLLAPALLLTGAASAQGDGGSRIYRASGRLPDWTLQIDRGTIRYFGDDGRTRVVVPAPVARPSFNGMRYVTPRITVDLTYAPGRVARSGYVYHDRGTVTVGFRTVRG